MRVSDADEDPVGRFEGLYREHGARLWRAVYAFAGDPDLADDAVAEAFTQAIRGAASIRDPLRWIWRVAFRIAAGELKQRGRRATRHEAIDPGDVDDRSRAMDLVRALAALSPSQRAAILLHHYAGYRTREVADMIGSTPGAVRVHLTVGRRKLRRLIGKNGHD